MRAISTAMLGTLFPLALTQSLNKPPLEGSLDYLQKGLLESLHPLNSSYKQWDPAWIPADCKTLTENNNLSAADVETFNVWYGDVSTDTDVYALTDQHSNALISVETTRGSSAVTKPALIP